MDKKEKKELIEYLKSFWAQRGVWYDQFRESEAGLEEFMKWKNVPLVFYYDHGHCVGIGAKTYNKKKITFISQQELE